MTFVDFFSGATRSDAEPKGREPFPYQARFAQSETLPHLLRAPTGAGKTATAILGWLWRYFHSGKPTPRRLVYCLPMRVLVEQSEREAKTWINNLDGAAKQVPVHVLMGGVDTDEWHLHPEKPAILIGTQDMLLSRALNRGYAEDRFHWPIDFGLLNVDALWVFDEPQLMANGVSTSAQLAGLRQAFEALGSNLSARCSSVWMSATLEPTWLDTIDFRGKFPNEPLELNDEDYDPKYALNKKMTADKTIASLQAAAREPKQVAKAILEHHVAGTQTLVVVNTVDRAKAVFSELDKARRKAVTPKLLLVHSRFRANERRQLNADLQAKGDAAADRIIVATQVVEAGVDISSRTLITELAPWASIVQRIGRCNRTGDDGPGHVFWIDLEEKQASPYSEESLAFARGHMQAMNNKSVSPKSLDDYKRDNEKPGEPFLPFEHKHVLRRRDLMDLFDTAPDLSGNDIDIQRFVRSDDASTDVQFFWRQIPKDGPADDEPNPERSELCSVSIGQAGPFLTLLREKGRGAGYVWDHLEGEWIEVRERAIRPGMKILLPSSAGGYDWSDEKKTGAGWNAESTESVPPIPLKERIRPEAAGADPMSERRRPLTIAEHTANVCKELEELIPLADQFFSGWTTDLRVASRWHDAGKAHDAFQSGMRNANPALAPDQLWAKSGTNARLRYTRKFFRHELASALAALHQGVSYRSAYLIAAHHGRARLAIRALPGEIEPKDPGALFALGVHGGDVLPLVDLGDGKKCERCSLDLSPMSMGGESSWTGRAFELLAEIGPFRLAYLEAILRAADCRASEKEARQ